ncbi:MAG: hypothetical protein RMK00_05730 [Bacteroidota bacterium]|nr:hypothetical protein [Candidatus Kapabacteria bacterium]MCX7937178.1 hypothetical protein [Chlorobiota bacterium]MDW8075255.1 hypothetical protein [Bacteroidota bacterium]
MRLVVGLLCLGLLFSCAERSEQPVAPQNRSPVIDSVVLQGIAIVGVPVEIHCYAHDPDGDSLAYFWRVADGNIVGSGSRVQFLPAPCCNGMTTTLQVTVRDQHGATDSRQIPIPVW